MGWFDEQIEYRKKRERQLMQDSFENIARSITGGRVASVFDENADLSDAIAQLLKYFRIKEKAVPPKIKTLEERLDYLLSSSGIMYREVILKEDWHNDAMGVMIAARKEDGAVITLLPGPFGGYVYSDPKTGKRVRVTKAEEKRIGEEAWCFYKPLPVRKLTLKDLVTFMFGTLSLWDLVSFGLAALAITLTGMLVPKLNRILMGQVVESESRQLLFAVLSFLFCASIGSLLLSIIRSLLLSRISMKLSLSTEAASMMRVLLLPAGFFKKYSSGELNEYLKYMNSLCQALANTFLSTGVTSIFSLVYLTQIFKYARSLVVPSLIVTVATISISLISSLMQVGINKENMTLAAKEKGLTFSLLNGIQKIRLSGAENRAFAKWSDLYAKEAALTYSKPLFIRLNSVFTTAISAVGTIVMYYIAVKSRVSVADYYAFNSAYAYISGAFAALAEVALTAAAIRPSLEIIMPLMEAEPETQEDKETLTGITGAVELAHVTFRYTKDGPAIFDDFSLSIPARQYVAVVGKTGCGKSTLMRLLLGFEKPEKGAIFYDRKDTRALDMRSVRRLIGTVMQDGMLFSGSIFENIAISAPTLTLDEAWEAAEIAGIAEDIRRMPMGMHTMVQDGGGGFSGGQRQRLMIARAVAPKPKLLLLDEATSALDNITQKQVSEALDKMKCTRIVIAHRLSTIRHCDRIIVIDSGHIVEDGTYEELIAKKGFFAELVARQRVDTEE